VGWDVTRIHAYLLIVTAFAGTALPLLEARLRARGEAEGLTIEAYIERIAQDDQQAEEELEALALEGLNSGELIEVNEKYWEENAGGSWSPKSRWRPRRMPKVQYLHEPLAREHGVVDEEWCLNQLADPGRWDTSFPRKGNWHMISTWRSNDARKCGELSRWLATEYSRISSRSANAGSVIRTWKSNEGSSPALHPKGQNGLLRPLADSEPINATKQTTAAPRRRLDG
jgi:hypothetical protein